jgi:chemotaxis response regulator CheB
MSILGALTADFPAAVFVALHRAAQSRQPELLTDSVAARVPLWVHTAEDEQLIASGHVYLAPADHHLLLGNGHIRLERSPKENRFRPSIDVLFKSAAAAYGHRVAAVLLSGSFGDDGAAGLWQVKSRGGVTIVQDPRDTTYPALPQNVMNIVDVDHVLPVSDIPTTLSDLAAPPAPNENAKPRVLIVEDESVVATNLQYSLSDMGYDVIDWTPSGEEAIDFALREWPDVILMDIHLAGTLTGIDTARRIWQVQQIPIIYCTALADLETLEAVQTTESYGYVLKPFQGPAIRAAIELALARREKELR